MASIYDIKPYFQQLLRPLVSKIASWGIIPNQVTLFAFFLSLLCGALLIYAAAKPVLFWILPLVLFIRMALNAIDGMLAKEFKLQSQLGAILNELTDMLSDTALYLPFALLPGSALWIIAIVILSIITEATGLAALQNGGSRRYDGPMGKSDRAFCFSVIAILLALNIISSTVLAIIWSIIVLLLCLTIMNRIYRSVQEVK